MNRTLRLTCVVLLPFTILATVSPVSAVAVELRRKGDRIDVVIGGRPFTGYYFGPDQAKPYLFPLRSAQGTVVTRGFPMARDIPEEDRDEPHQRAMYFAHGDINGYDFWGEAEFPRWSSHSAATFGRTTFVKLDEMRVALESGTIKAEFHLAAPDGKVIARETQAYTFRGDERLRIIDCEFTIHADNGPVRIGDTKEGTFAIRLVKALELPAGHMVNSNGAKGEKEIWGKRADWVDYYGNIAGEIVGIAVFDDPHNLRHPTYWHARQYGLLAANPFGLRDFLHDRRQDGSYTIVPGESLALRYRVLIHHGDPGEAGLTDAYSQYVNRK
jgi:hypothetical protein